LLEPADREHLVGMLEKLAARLAGHAQEGGHPSSPEGDGAPRKRGARGIPPVRPSRRRLARPEEA
jgi:hypothetical protein